mgnify:CR=1 FL=1
MNIFETQIQQYQRALSDINLQYMAVKHMGAEEKVYWNSYQDYLSWAIDNAKAGWNLFNKYGKEVFKNKVGTAMLNHLLNRKEYCKREFNDHTKSLFKFYSIKILWRII